MAKIDPNESCPCGSGKKFKDCHEPLVITNKPPIISQKVKLKVIPQPEHNARSVFIKQGIGTVLIQGYTSEIALCCGNCEAPIIIGVEPKQIIGVVFKCNSCGAFNDTI